MPFNIENDLDESEDFWSALRSVAKVSADARNPGLTTGSPFLGPIGGPIAAIAGTAIGIVGGLSNRSESEIEPATDYKAHASRAILAEAALETTLKMDSEQLQRYGLLQKMPNVYQKNKPADVASTSQTLTPVLTSLAEQLSTAQTGKSDNVATASYPKVISNSEQMKIATNSRQTAFVAGLQGTARGADHQEGFVDFLGQVAHVGIQTTPAVAAAIPSLKNKQVSSNTEGERSKDDEQWNVLVKRSLMGEAALQALMAIPLQRLQEEGIFDHLIETIYDIGDTVIKAAPTVNEAVTPLVSNTVAGNANAGR